MHMRRRELIALIVAAMAGRPLVARARQLSWPSDLDNVLAFFYRDPRPERLVGIFASLQGLPLMWNAYPPVAGLFAGVFSLVQR